MKRFLTVMAVVATVFAMSSCKEDKGIVNPIPETTFTDESGLSLTYSGAPMFGKVVKFVPQGTDRATLTLSGAQLDLSGLMSDSSLPAALSTPGVIPGELTTTLNVDLSVDGDKVSFEGTDEKSGRIINFKGEATGSTMSLDLNVTMPENEFTGKSWSLVSGAPIHIVWAADEFPFADGTWDIQSAILLTLSMAPVQDGMTVLQLLPAVLNKVTFLADGNISAEYKDSPADAAWKTSVLNMAMYAVKDGKIYLYLNPAQIASMVPESKADDPISGLIGNVIPMLTNGVPVSYSTTEDGKTNFYLGMDVLLPLLQQVAPLFEDEAVIEMLVELLKQNAGEMAGLVDAFLKPVLVAFPNIVATTTDIQIGVSMLPAVEE